LLDKEDDLVEEMEKSIESRENNFDKDVEVEHNKM